jgi:predicted  nucleic acid-binding Zn-ribbon protein
MNKTILYVLMALILVFSVFGYVPAEPQLGIEPGYQAVYEPTITSDVPSGMAYVDELYEFDVDATTDGVLYTPITYDFGSYDGLLIYPMGGNANYIMDAPYGMSIDTNTGEVTWTPEVGQLGQVYAFSVVATNVYGNDTQSMTITVYENHRPEIDSILDQTVEAELEFTYEIVASDDDGDALTFSAWTYPETTLTIDQTTGVITWTPVTGEEGNYTVAVEATDGTDDAPTKFFDLEVTEATVQPNNIPTIDAILNQTVEANQTFTYTATASDVDVNDTLTFSLTQAPGSMTIDSVTGEMTWTPIEGEEGNYTVTVEVTDGTDSASTDFNLEVTEISATPTNNVPTIDAILAQTVEANQTFTLNATASDADVNDTLTFSVASNPTNGLTIDSVTGEMTWTPVEGEEGNYTVTVEVTDGTDSASTDFNLEVTEIGAPTEPNNAPVMDEILDQTAPESIEFTYIATATDADVNDTLTFSLVSYPAGMSLNSTSGVITWTPDATAIGDNSVTVSVTDGTDSASESFTITVSEMTELDQLGLDLDDLEDDINGLEDNLDTLESDVEDAWEEYEDAEDDSDDDDMDDAQDDLDDLEDDLDDYEDDLDDLQDRLDDLEDDLDDLTKTVDNEDQYEDYEDQIDELQEDIDDLVDMIAELYDLIEDGELDSDSSSSSSSTDSSTTYTPTYTYTDDDDGEEDVEVVTTPSNYVPYVDTESTVTEDKSDNVSFLVIGLLAALVLLGAVGVFLMLVILFKK